MRIRNQAKPITGILSPLLVAWTALNHFVSAAMLPSNIQQLGQILLENPWYITWIPTILALLTLAWAFAPRIAGDKGVSFMAGNGDDRSVRNVFGNSGVINTGDIWQRAPDRNLNGSLQRQLLSMLDPTLPVEFRVANDQEAQRFASEIEHFIRQNGYVEISRVDVMMSSLTQPPDPGRELVESVRLSFWVDVVGQGPVSGAC
ncbi:hypothetical protein, partial [Glycocaulis sp.]|uniref:hypothetical protein n=1 Tax=Glycocaulis sp. TaxID=1969725 RepID=UPI0025C5BEF8